MNRDDSDTLDWSRGSYILFDAGDGLVPGRFNPQRHPEDKLSVRKFSVKDGEVRHTRKVVSLPCDEIAYGPFFLNGKQLPKAVLRLLAKGKFTDENASHTKKRKTSAFIADENASNTKKRKTTIADENASNTKKRKTGTYRNPIADETICPEDLKIEEVRVLPGRTYLRRKASSKHSDSCSTPFTTEDVRLLFVELKCARGRSFGKYNQENASLLSDRSQKRSCDAQQKPVKKLKMK